MRETCLIIKEELKELMKEVDPPRITLYFWNLYQKNPPKTTKHYIGKWLIIRHITITSYFLNIWANFSRNLWTMTQKTAFSQRIGQCQKWNSDSLVQGAEKIKKIQETNLAASVVLSRTQIWKWKILKYGRKWEYPRLKIKSGADSLCLRGLRWQLLQLCLSLVSLPRT